MTEIPPITVQIKTSSGHEKQYVLVHDGARVIQRLEPGAGRVVTPAGNTMLAGTKQEIDAEIARLGLAQKPSHLPANRPSPRTPPVPIPPEDRSIADAAKEMP